MGCAAALVIALGGCTTAIVPTDSAQPPSESSSLEPSAEPSATVAAQQPGIVVESGLGSTAVLPSDVKISIVDASLTEVTAGAPGDVTGPAIVATVQIENGTASSLDLGSTIVTMTDASGGLAQPNTAAPFDPFTAVVPAGGSLRGVYVFSVGAGLIDPVSISISYAGGAPSALFTGPVL